jgi:thymidylate kinase
VIYDRHALDAVAARSATTPKARLRRWILGHAIPRPELVIVLDAPAEVLYARKGEHTVALLDEQRRGYLELARDFRSAEVVDATRSADAVRRDITARTWRRLARGDRRG